MARQKKDSQQGNVWKRGDNYYLRVKIDGKDVYKNFGPDAAKARLAAAEYHKQLAIAKVTKSNEEMEKLFSVREALSFGDAATQYLQARGDLKASSLRSYHNYFNNYLQPVFGKVDLRAIKEDDVEKFLQGLAELGLSPKHCNDIVRYAKAVCNVQLKRENIRRNPFAGARLLRESVSSSREKIDPLDAGEVELALGALPEQRKSIFMMLAFTGMRPAEAFALRWKDVDWRKHELKIRRARVKGVEDAPKTESSIREVFLIPRVVEMLKDLKKQQKVCGLDDYIFTRADGKPYDKYIDDSWTRALKKVGIRHRPSYQLRHSFISNSLQAGVDPGWIARQVGHANLKMIYEVYGRYIPVKDNRNTDKITSLFSVSSTGLKSTAR